ncbi:MAG: fatty acid desaturase, partial [Gammaproteobacteria bacterium]|nr:fatty acid desaturase [Gammaproteobacteria bacterium]
LLCGFIMSSNTIAAHELMHRLSNRMELFFAQILLAMNLDTQSAISHVYSHHANVGTDQDAATARRGETVYGFILRSTIGQYRESIEIESKRLHKLGKPVFSLHNKVISGFLLILLLVLVIYLLSDGYGVWVFFFSGLFSKFMFESVNYIQHYGLIRVPGTRVEPRHSWDCMSRAGTKTFYALARHSHHHARASLPYWELAPADKQQVLYLKYGYLGEMLIALIPPLWFTHTSPQLLEWDANLACPEEAELAREANRKSGLHALAAGAA